MHAAARRTALAFALSFSAGYLLPPSAGAQSTAWSEALLVGTSLQLVDGTTIEELRFGPEGAISVTNGKRDGPLVGVAMKWRILKGRLDVGYPDSYDSFELVSIEGTKVVVKRRSGKKAVFKLVRQ